MTERVGVRGEPVAGGEAMDSGQVCDIVAAVAAEVLAEVRSGRWRPPASLRLSAPSAAGPSAAGPFAAGRDETWPPVAVHRLRLIADDRGHRARLGAGRVDVAVRQHRREVHAVARPEFVALEPDVDVQPAAQHQ
jgi:hypothetical protein